MFCSLGLGAPCSPDFINGLQSQLTTMADDFGAIHREVFANAQNSGESAYYNSKNVDEAVFSTDPTSGALRSVTAKSSLLTVGLRFAAAAVSLAATPLRNVSLQLPAYQVRVFHPQYCRLQLTRTHTHTHIHTHTHTRTGALFFPFSTTRQYVTANGNEGAGFHDALNASLLLWHEHAGGVKATVANSSLAVFAAMSAVIVALVLFVVLPNLLFIGRASDTYILPFLESKLLYF
jgi:hypothetical protein